MCNEISDRVCKTTEKQLEFNKSKEFESNCPSVIQLQEQKQKPAPKFKLKSLAVVSLKVLGRGSSAEW